ncbi:MAG: hypothetical protein A3C50_02380 [Candidatus Staskawiczbacteria bacterium RIFCSPHIGHO2_02_FULL_43_16]|uniref:Uncharacterized protein n=1 Tax=Candidatus Staskawiczbacteria bacterium RIFCSPHIGHO2_01_FULL_41_41 TaxID=1802203 RepID=A0A1G2HWD2_9BACT|nr:MAG: hypothetical protein A2822_00750 [Candidatus Staskawiczbacteria bacterium RIFCSPHIGHO2_01_FULL_41_41]OGZ68523.1 MAG: hypothetical protein A3C50_02380 [Candidatus Staskawiczbacteria bacterium RIFCSPHIGHO2_02_FULL_43_16]OGZ74326.1 MAG: hypothetical protein A3A12_02815 [Candidatus Staskawiczbacteria bacterium RIFCSPLOWO2_01_FULL_43_17b]
MKKNKMFSWLYRITPLKISALLRLRKPQKYVLPVAIAVGVAVVVLGGLIYANVGFLNITGYFEKHDPYKDSMVLFFHNECLYCAKVDDYLRDSNAAEKLQYIRLNVLESDYNRNELQDKAQTCGLDVESIGVPFLWDGQSKQCIIGYIDIINFFNQKLKKP